MLGTQRDQMTGNRFGKSSVKKMFSLMFSLFNTSNCYHTYLAFKCQCWICHYRYRQTQSKGSRWHFVSGFCTQCYDDGDGGGLANPLEAVHIHVWRAEQSIVNTPDRTWMQIVQHSTLSLHLNIYMDNWRHVTSCRVQILVFSHDKQCLRTYAISVPLSKKHSCHHGRMFASYWMYAATRSFDWKQNLFLKAVKDIPGIKRFYIVKTEAERQVKCVFTPKNKLSINTKSLLACI